ncbi:uncharacterized protein A4U43_C10F11490 [Asparagus officinalis]|uniref:Uncharacterized protein n=1 Tax=Asparagus officinalis TaxID=4686 RepID=A0A5P1E249_ASPOF|nr:uncharacterized protein A4U43_C10F11490 [Asparagus officinalis]
MCFMFHGKCAISSTKNPIILPTIDNLKPERRAYPRPLLFMWKRGRHKVFNCERSKRVWKLVWFGSKIQYLTCFHPYYWPQQIYEMGAMYCFDSAVVQQSISTLPPIVQKNATVTGDGWQKFTQILQFARRIHWLALVWSSKIILDQLCLLQREGTCNFSCVQLMEDIGVMQEVRIATSRGYRRVIIEPDAFGGSSRVVGGTTKSH